MDNQRSAPTGAVDASDGLVADRSTDAVRLAIDEARREQGRHIAIRVMEQPSGRILSSVYAREAQI